MSDPVIHVENISKAYRIGLKEQLPDNLLDVAMGWLRAPLRNFRNLRRLNTFSSNGDEDDIIWALRHVSFDVQEGEVLGIIGRNGAGKSTLLKVLSRITEPTAGRAVIRGRVSSLLEVGTGFHPDMTGRENIYMNGTILGMTKREIDRKFDEIVDFSGVKRFLDTPIKRYSSGMKVRLAFSVAAHLEPEILIIDEVLAVGDAEFQKRCLGKMEHVAGEGRTVLFVSHNMGAVRNLCTRCLMLSTGCVTVRGDSNFVVDSYLRAVETNATTCLSERNDRRGTGESRLAAIDITMGNGHDPGHLLTGSPARFVFHLTSAAPSLECRFTIYDQRGQPISTFQTDALAAHGISGNFLPTAFICQIDELMLRPGHYRLNAALFSAGRCVDHVEGATMFTVEPGSVRGTCVSTGSDYGSVWFPHTWSVRRE